MSTTTRYVALGTKSLSVFLGVLAIVWGAAPLIFGLTPHGDATPVIRLYGLGFMILGVMWALPNRWLARYCVVVFLIFSLVAGAGIYSIIRLYTAELGPETLDEMFPMIIGIIPFIPMVSLFFYLKQRREQPSNAI